MGKNGGLWGGMFAGEGSRDGGLRWPLRRCVTNLMSRGIRGRGFVNAIDCSLRRLLTDRFDWDFSGRKVLRQLAAALH